MRGSQQRGDLVRRIESLRTMLEEPVVIDEQPLRVGVSMGVSIYPYDAIDQTIMQKADLALSKARSTASGRTEYYDLMLAEDVASSVRLERDLHEAVRDSSLIPYYQPIVDGRGRIRAVEALVRWNHRQLGILAPSAFLEVAEESGLVVDLGERMLQQSCSDMAALRKRRPSLRLNLNLSSRHLLSRRLPDMLRRVLEEQALPPAALQLEVTEQSLIADVSAGRNAIEMLRSLGASVVIDDFGTGYNTLTYLKYYHVDGIKLDRVFVKDMLTDRYSRAICEGVVVMARSLDLHIIAEGIENAAQRDAAMAMGCDELQGFLFGDAMGIADMRALLGA
jgi:EAL domain-containing protein (putative c-di-GMP-specific phosphodiesterase class I)